MSQQDSGILVLIIMSLSIGVAIGMTLQRWVIKHDIKTTGKHELNDDERIVGRIEEKEWPK